MIPRDNVQARYEVLSYEEALRRAKIPGQDVIRRFGTWVVTKYGVECLATYYPLQRSRLQEGWPNGYTWPRHMREQHSAWIIPQDFEAAYFFALSSLSKPAPLHRINLSTRFQIMRRDGFLCQLCGASAQDGARLEVDHKVPRARGGNNSDENRWTLCFRCNRGKRDQVL